MGPSPLYFNHREGNTVYAGELEGGVSGGTFYQGAYYYDIVETETAWAAEDVGVHRFVDKGNWATYIEYTVHGKVLVNTVEVDSKTNYYNTINHTSNPISSHIALENGVTYELAASGTYTYDGGWADAEYYLKNGEIVKGDTGGSAPNVLDVAIDDFSLNLDWDPDGVYNEMNEYSIQYTGTGASLQFAIPDSYSGDNSDVITVCIYRCY